MSLSPAEMMGNTAVFAKSWVAPTSSPIPALTRTQTASPIAKSLCRSYIENFKSQEESSLYHARVLIAINDMNELFADPHIQSRGMQMELEGLPAIRSPMRFSDSELATKTAAPKLGAHTDEILKRG